MNEEEKEALKNAKEILKFTTYLSDIGHKDLEILLNLIEKQQKEIQELNILLKEKSKDIGYMIVNYISKDKIRDLINYRQFELQQEFKDFKDDIRLNTLQEIYYMEEK